MIKTLTENRKAYLVLHFCIILWGFTAILGKVIDMSALWLVCWRMLLTTCVIVLLPNVLRLAIGLPARIRWQLVGIGCFVALHWLCFYGSIKLANASVALVTMATASFFTAIIEPFVTRSRFKWYELLLGIGVVPGIYLITSGLQVQQLNGFYVGILSAILQAFFASFNKIMVGTNTDGRVITLVELGSGAIFLAVGIILYTLFQGGGFTEIAHEASKITATSKAGSICGLMPIAPNWLYLLILAAACTALPFVLSLWSLRSISAFTAALALNLEPVYGILLAIPLLCENDELPYQFYIGVAIILASVFMHPFLRSRFEKE